MKSIAPSDGDMLAMLLEKPNQPLQARHIPILSPAADEVLIRVTACGVCRTGLHIADGERFFTLASQFDLQTVPVPFALLNANQALAALRAGEFDGAAVLISNEYCSNGFGERNNEATLSKRNRQKR